MKTYQNPEMSLVVIAVEDIITASVVEEDNNVNADDVMPG